MLICLNKYSHILEFISNQHWKMFLLSFKYCCLLFLTFYRLNFVACVGRVCFGTNNGVSHTAYTPTNASKRNTDFKLRFSNCSKVEGNLELVYLTDEKAKLDFLKTIEEVTGYVLVLSTYAKVLSLPKLRIIRGETLFRATDPETKETSSYSLYVAMNHRDDISDIGLHEMIFSSLTEISTGNVLIRDNRLLCHAKDVFWEDIFADPRSKVHVSQSKTLNRRFCEECAKNCRIEHPSVMKSHCWTTRICQKLNKVVCSKSCEGRCYGEKAEECCHPECASGCHGSTNADCFFCKHYKDVDKCVSMCPPTTIFDQRLKVMVPNPGGKFVHQSRCVDDCPGHMLVDKGACVVFCGDGFKPGPGNKCIPCHENCPKTCSVHGRDWIHSKNIGAFNNCTSVHGSIQILDVSFHGDTKRNITPMSVELLNNLRHVEEVSDFVEINTQHEQLNNLNFLNNLRFIHGRNTKTSDKHRPWSLIIQSTKLNSLGLESLESIENGGVLITRNKQLCYVDSYHWSSVVKEDSEVVVVDNRDVAACEAEGRVCSEECTSSGCTGGSNTHCKDCLNFRFENLCLSNCHNNSLNIGLYRVNGTKLCSPCHPQCLGGCSGPSNRECLEGCKNFEENSTCVDRCSIGFYADDGRICRTCPEPCMDGCSGNETRLGVGGCNKCHLTLFNTTASESLKRETLFSIKCIQPFNTTHACPTGFYLVTEDKQRSNHGACKKCDKRCVSCVGPGNSISSCTCHHFSEDDRCVNGCSSGFYEDKKLECMKCHNLCSSCLGPDAGDCTSCSGFAHLNDLAILAENISTSKINCTDVCPSGVSYVQTVGSHLVCVKQEFADRSSNHLVMWIAPLFAFVIVFIIAFSLRAKFVKRKLSCDENNSNLQNQQSPADKKGKPDMTRLKLINENELRRGNIIGSGAFGTVYKGYWVPTGKKIKISVAIKVLQEENNINNDGEQDSLLEEARIMASVVHPCCVHILAVCLTSPMMLVTQLMPLGCLLEYIKKNKLQIGSGLLLNWSLQIAKGMLYLEQNNIVHRDLAARNVLLQSAEHVKITDFGLAKMVDSNAGEFRSNGGKLPIKWLALESIKDRIFSHKTDVWSYGITLWELFTFGQRPYDNIAASSMLSLLEKGERLPQPEICTIDVYMVMIKCWLVDASNRPDFKELSEEFGKMAQDPGQYLSVPFDEIAKAAPKQPVISHLARTPRHRVDELNQRAFEEATDDSELSHTFSGNKRQPSIKTCLIQKKAKLCQKVASCKHLSNFPLEKVDNRPRWKFGRHMTPPFSRETSFTTCRYSPSPHFGKSSPHHRIQLPPQRLPQSVSSPAELIYSPSTEENQKLWPVHREASGYISPDKENRAYLQLIDHDLNPAEKNYHSPESTTADENNKTKWQPRPRKNDSHMMSFDNLEYFHQNHDLT